MSNVSSTAVQFRDTVNKLTIIAKRTIKLLRIPTFGRLTTWLLFYTIIIMDESNLGVHVPPLVAG